MLELTQRVGLVETSEIHDHLTLPYELRQRGRLRAKTDTGYDVGLFLDRGPVLREGAFLEARTGEIIRIRAADEPVVTAYIEPGLPMARLCYHLGNRHVALQIGASGAIDDEPTGENGPVDDKTGWIRFPPDHVLEELAERLGATLVHHQAPFDPEPGAYAKAGQAHGHSHSHSHSHSQSDSHHHGHGHSHG